jgi:hypothetical protein
MKRDYRFLIGKTDDDGICIKGGERMFIDCIGNTELSMAKNIDTAERLHMPSDNWRILEAWVHENGLVLYHYKRSTGK